MASSSRCTSRRRPSASSTCTWPAARRTWRRSTTSRSSPKMHGQPMPESFTKGQPIAQLQGHKLNCFGPQHAFKKCGKSGPGDLEHLPAHRRGRRRDLHHPLAEDRGDQPRPGPHLHEHRHDHLRPAGDGLVAAVRPRQRERQPARLRRADLARAGPASSSRSRPGSGTAASCPADSRASSSAPRAIRSSTSTSPHGVSAEQQRDVVDAVQALNELQNKRRRRPGNRHAHRPVRDGLPDADQRAGADGPRRTSRSRSSTCTAPKAGDGSFAANCLLARRLAERGVRFIQLYHRDWDHHGGIKNDMQGRRPRRSTRPRPRCIKDLKQRGMLDDTLVIWGGEFGRTPMAQGNGRDHHIKGFSIWMAGGGIKGGITYGSHRRTRLQRRRGRRPRPRPARHDAAPAGHRPQAADLSSSRAATSA